MRRARGKKPSKTKQYSPSVDGADGGKPVARSAWKRIAGALWQLAVIAERAFYVPDPRRIWASAAVSTATRLARARHFDAVVTSSPPFSAHFVGLALQQRFGIPWVADFRDLWVGRPYRNLPYRWHHYLDRKYEAAVVRNCDRLVFASPGWEPIFVRRYGPWVSPKVSVITNGYDQHLMNSTTELGAKAVGELPITLLYTGAIHEGESPMPVAQALSNVARKMGASRVRASLRVKLIGPGGEDWGHLREFMRTEALEGVVEFLGVMSHRDCLKEQQAADVLLILSAPPHDETIRGKSFEYMAVGKPILALLPESSVQAEILGPSGLATVIQHGDVENCAKFLERIITDGVPSIEPNWAYIKQFERKELSAAFASILSESANVITDTTTGGM